MHLSLRDIHEAGHMLICRKFNIPVYGYDVGQDEQGEFDCVVTGPCDDPLLQRYILAGGAAAEMVVFDRIASSPRQLASDLESASWLSREHFEDTARIVSFWLSKKEVIAEATVAHGRFACVP